MVRPPVKVLALDSTHVPEPSLTIANLPPFAPFPITPMLLPTLTEVGAAVLEPLSVSVVVLPVVETPVTAPTCKAPCKFPE